MSDQPSDPGSPHDIANATESTPDNLRDRLRSEAGIIEWSELVRHFARGVVIRVSGSEDLLDVAASMAEDDAGKLEAWIACGTVRRATDDDARDWTTREPRFLCVVAAPWVVVQEAEDSSAKH